jgi:putative selenate reductase
VPVDDTEVVLPADAIVPAIGQEPVLDFLEGVPLERNRDGTLRVDRDTRETSLPGLFAGGDVVRGAASVIKAIADGGAVAREIGRRHGVEPEPEPRLEKHVAPVDLLAKKSRKVPPQTVPVLPVPERGGFAEVIQSLSPDAAAAEASRCLDCDDLCSLCVTVCPNRANHAYPITALKLELPSLTLRGGELVAGDRRPFSIDQQVQIVNIGDFCNECGNCWTFCPTAGAPYRSKPRFWIDPAGYEEAKGDAFRMQRTDGGLTIEAKIDGQTHRLERRAEVAEYRSERLVARFEPTSWALLGVEPTGTWTEGEAIDLGPCATLIALLAAEPTMPGAREDGTGPRITAELETLYERIRTLHEARTKFCP